MILHSLLNCICHLLLCFAERSEANQLLVWGGSPAEIPLFVSGNDFPRIGKFEWLLLTYRGK